MAFLKTPNFSLELSKDDNGLSVNISGNAYSGNYYIYCTKDEYADFVTELATLYNTLKEGKAEVREVYEDNFICFTTDGLGHFIVSGEYNDWGNWNLKFSESCDQTYFKNFVNNLLHKND